LWYPGSSPYSTVAEIAWSLRPISAKSNLFMSIGLERLTKEPDA